MREWIDIKGASDVVYRFNLFRDGWPLSPMGGNFIYVREVGESYEVIHVGQTRNLLTDSRLDWDQAETEHGATHLFTRLNVSETTRQHEHADITEAFKPPMTPRARADQED